MVLTSHEALVKVSGGAFSCSHPKFVCFCVSSQGLRMTSSETFVGGLTILQLVLCLLASECFGIFFFFNSKKAEIPAFLDCF